jgi:hypothetical protein
MSRPGFVLFVCLLAATPVAAQDAPTSPAPAIPSFRSLFVDLPSDALHLGTLHTLEVVGAGAILAVAVAAEDGDITRRAVAARTMESALDPGQVLGGGVMQLGGALGTYLVARAAGSARGAVIGGELVRAQILNGAVTQGLKYAVGRRRPDGARFSFPSGHASATFATAAVLQRELGWRVGAAAYVLGSYVAVSRLSENKHFASDVAVGAAIGIASGHAVTLGHGRRRLTLAPYAGRGERGVHVAWQTGERIR